MRRSRGLFALVVLIGFSACPNAQSVPQNRLLVPAEPTPNFGQFKTRLIAYHECVPNHGCYVADLNRQSDLAIAYLQRRVAKIKAAEKLALVLDIDETALSNWDEEKKDDFGYIEQDWNAWVTKKQAPAIAGTLRLYNEALKDGVPVFVITGRSAAQEAGTADNLKAAGYHDWTGLVLRGPHPSGQSMAEYKSAERKKIVDAGYRIILNVGDQMSDLRGNPQAEFPLSCRILFTTFRDADRDVRSTRSIGPRSDPGARVLRNDSVRLATGRATGG